MHTPTSSPSAVPLTFLKKTFYPRTTQCLLEKVRRCSRPTRLILQTNILIEPHEAGPKNVLGNKISTFSHTETCHHRKWDWNHCLVCRT